MTIEPVTPQPSGDASDPAALPLFDAPAPRPGRVRGGFSMRPRSDAPVPLQEARHRRAVVNPSGQTGSSRSGEDQGTADWGLVTAFRTLVAGRLAQALGRDWRERAESEDSPDAGISRPTMDRTAQEQYGWSVINDLLNEHTADAVATGAQAWTTQQQAVIAQAVFDAVFRLGRLQPLVDDDRVENIFIIGCRRVLLELVDGSRIPGPASRGQRRGAHRLPAVPGTPVRVQPATLLRVHSPAAHETRRRSTPGRHGVGGQCTHGGHPTPPVEGRQPCGVGRTRLHEPRRARTSSGRWCGPRGAPPSPGRCRLARPR